MRSTFITGIFFLAVSSIIYSCQSADRLEQDMYYTNGRDLYITHCQNCHGEKGEGLGELAPPLTDTVFLKDNKDRLACIIKNGLEGPITVAGKVYDEKMPDEKNMADIDIAQLIVYITNSFGNKQGMYKTEEVKQDLKNCN
jgi:mono/diheme cytochrome c family protein